MTIVDDNVGLAVLGDLGDHFFFKKSPEKLKFYVPIWIWHLDSGWATAPSWVLKVPTVLFNSGTVEMNNELTSLPWPRSNSHLNCLKESWLVWRNLSGKTCLRCPLVSWKRQVQKVKKVKNKIGRNIRLAMWQANLSDVNSRMICKEHEQRIIKTSAEASYQGCRVNPNAGHQMPRTGIVKAHSHEPQKKNCSFYSWTVVLSKAVMSLDYWLRWHKNRPVCGPFPFAYPVCRNESPLADFTIYAPDSFILETIKLAFFCTSNSTRLIQISKKSCWLRLLSLELLSLSTSGLFFMPENTKKVHTIEAVNGIKRPYAFQTMGCRK